MTILSPRRAAAALLAVLVAAPAAAQDGFTADRPGIGNGPGVIVKGAVQVEAGLPTVVWLSPGTAEGRVVAFPVLVRWGVADGVELRAGASVHNRMRLDLGPATLERRGAGDLELGAKVVLYRNAGTGVGVSVLPSVVLETGHRDFTGGGEEYGVDVAATFPVGAGIAVVPVVAASSLPAGEDGRRNTLLAAGAGVTWPVVRKVEGFAEVAYLGYGRTPDKAYAGGGLMWRVAPRVQLDASVDRGLTGGSDDWIASAGISVRVR